MLHRLLVLNPDGSVLEAEEWSPGYENPTWCEEINLLLHRGGVVVHCRREQIDGPDVVYRVAT